MGFAQEGSQFDFLEALAVQELVGNPFHRLEFHTRQNGGVDALDALQEQADTGLGIGAELLLLLEIFHRALANLDGLVSHGVSGRVVTLGWFGPAEGSVG